jgi:tryptophan halogenase
MKKVVIVGGGTTGWVTALYLNREFSDLNITLVESNSIGIMGVGEGSTVNFHLFIQKLGINIEDFLKETKSTNKLGINFVNWKGDGGNYFHNFLNSNGEKESAFHFDSNLLVQYFRKISKSRGINVIEGIVSKVNLNEDKSVNTLELDNGRILDLDYVFDASGFKELILGNIYKPKWISYEPFLKVNEAITFFQDSIGKMETTTTSTAMKYGWMFEIPLQHRTGSGYNYDSNYISAEEAKIEVEEYLGKQIKINKILKYKPGMYEKVYIKNCIGIGLSSGFLEPLEATSIMNVITQLSFTEDVFNGNHTIYNEKIRELYTESMLFIYYHYLTDRNDTEFWKKYNSGKLTPNEMYKFIDLNYNIKIKDDVELRNLFKFENTFELYSWNTINYGSRTFKKFLI